MASFKNSMTHCKLPFPAGSPCKSPSPLFLFKFTLLFCLAFLFFFFHNLGRKVKILKPILQNNLKLGILKGMSLQAVRGKVFQGLCCSMKQPLTTVSHPTVCSSLDYIFQVHNADKWGTQCREQLQAIASISNTYLWCLGSRWTEHMVKVREELQLLDINKGSKINCSCSHICETVSYVGAGSLCGCFCGHLSLHNIII